MLTTDSTQTHSAFEVVAVGSSKTCFFFKLDCHIHIYIIVCWGSSVGLVARIQLDHRWNWIRFPAGEWNLFVLRNFWTATETNQPGINESHVFIRHRNAFTFSWLPFCCPKYRKRSRSWINCLRTIRNNVAFGEGDSSNLQYCNYTLLSGIS